MDYFKQACCEILEEIRIRDIKTQYQLNQVKLRILNKYKSSGIIKQIPKNADLYFSASEAQRQALKELLSLKPVRTISGVAPVALMSDPYPCPHSMKGIGPCTYCPGGPGSPFGDVPQSYTGREPSTRRAIRNNYDPYLIVFNRLEHYVAMGRVPDKAEIIIQGGTFPFFPKAYQEYFIKYALKAMNDFSRLFFSKDGSIEISKVKKFFELPRVLSQEDRRTNNIQRKLLSIKHLDLEDFKIWKKVTKLFFDSDIHSVNDLNINNYVGRINESENYTMHIVENKIQNPNFLAINKIQDKIKNEDNRALTLKHIQEENETSLIRCIGLTIETKSDFGKLYHGNSMLELGCTRVEIGVQSIYDSVLLATNRANTVADNIESIRILKDLGFKINCHYMPGLPMTTKEMDINGLISLFEDPDYRPDMLKIYPCMVMEGTKLYDDWKAGKFNPLTTMEAAEIIAEAKRYVPPYIRLMRLQRDIPSNITSAGVDRTNLRQYVEKLAKETGIRCRCIRCREIGHFEIKTGKKLRLDDIEIITMEYEASKGKEFFISAENVKNDVLIGFVRLRFPSQFLREEITYKSALIRELHVFSPATQIGKSSEDTYQHKGIGKSLMNKAEEIATQNGKNKTVVISGIGARQYFARLNYDYDGPYMSKML